MDVLETCLIPGKHDQLMESGIPRLAHFQTKPYMYMGPPHEIAFSWFISVAEFYGLW